MGGKRVCGDEMVNFCVLIDEDAQELQDNCENSMA